jgi:cytochrome c oxidase subunit II
MRRVVLLIALVIAASFVPAATSADPPKVIEITAKRYEYPQEIALKKGVTTILQLTTEDRSHGFECPDLKIREDILPGKTIEVKVTPDKPGDFEFFCDIYCGAGHENMLGKIKVVD